MGQSNNSKMFEATAKCGRNHLETGRCEWSFGNGTPRPENWFSAGQAEFVLQKRATNHRESFREANQWTGQSYPNCNQQHFSPSILKVMFYPLLPLCLLKQLDTDIVVSIVSP